MVWMLAIVLAVALVVAVVALAFVARDLSASRAEIARLHEELDRAQYTLVRSAGRKAVKAAVKTAARVRDQGVSGMLMSSIEDLTGWAIADRGAIAEIAGPDGTVTIMFSDIVDSTALNERIGDARWVQLLETHDRLVHKHVSHCHGHIVKSQGDGFMVAFGDPGAALRAGIAIQSGFGAPHRRLRRTPIRVRVGMHTGTAIERDGDFFGRNVAMAARVAALAAGGEILVSDDVRAALVDEPDFEFADAGVAELKGLPGTHQLWSVPAS